MSSALTAMSAGEDLPHFDLGPGDGVLGRGARHRLGEHVGQQIGVGDELDLVRGRRRPSIGVVLDPLASEGGVLGIRAQYWMVLELVVDWQIERVARHDVLVVDLSLSEHVPDPLLGGLDVLRELPDADVARSVGLVAALGAAEAPVVVDAIGGGELSLLCPHVEMGRAACRGRGENSGGAGFFKKKKKKIEESRTDNKQKKQEYADKKNSRLREHITIKRARIVRDK